jgi:peptidoglycan/xylan/chitin deacetylase (PgdA/CDA1 family)
MGQMIGDDPADGRRVGRRSLLRDTAVAALGSAVGVVGFAEATHVADRKLPIRGGAAAATTPSRLTHPGHGQLVVTWAVATEQPLVALTFDDGPKPNWTPTVLDILDGHAVPATFYLVGHRVRRYGHLLRGRLDRHEIGNHTWSHPDLARLDEGRARAELSRAHEAILEVTGRAPRLFRPPYGHLGGAAALAASELGYELVLWSQQMRESEFPGDPVGHARAIARDVVPGTILLAHDVGPDDRLVAIHGLPLLITALLERGFEFVTVSELMARAAGGARP